MKALGIGLIAVGVAATIGTVMVTFFVDPKEALFPAVVMFGWVVGISAFTWGAIAATGEARTACYWGSRSR